MAHVIDALPLRGLRKAHLAQLSSYIRQRDCDGWYYGPKDQFNKRHADLLRLADWLDEIYSDPDARLPNVKDQRLSDAEYEEDYMRGLHPPFTPPNVPDQRGA
jgi:hypothetical protein